MVRKKHTYVPEMIENALMELLSEKSFTDITVSELVARAEVSRASFYRNFNTTTDVLDQLMDHFFHHLLLITEPILRSSDRETWQSFIRQYTYFVIYSERHFLQIIPDNTTLILNGFVSRTRKIRNSLAETDTLDEYAFVMKLFSINGALIAWNERGRKDSIETIIDLLTDYVSR